MFFFLVKRPPPHESVFPGSEHLSKGPQKRLHDISVNSFGTRAPLKYVIRVGTSRSFRDLRALATSNGGDQGLGFGSVKTLAAKSSHATNPPIASRWSSPTTVLMAQAQTIRFRRPTNQPKGDSVEPPKRVDRHAGILQDQLRR